MSVLNLLGIDTFELVVFLVEHIRNLVAAIVLLIVILPPLRNEGKHVYASRGKSVMVGLAAIVLVLIIGTFLCSHEDAVLNGHSILSPSLRQVIENYIHHGQGNVDDIIESGQNHPKLGWTELKYLMKDLLGHAVLHLDSHNGDNIAEGYNKGNDWFESTLGKSMIYTSGIFTSATNDTLEDAQKRKLDYIASSIGLQQGDKLLDIGCGWGSLVKYFTEEYGANATGITLSSDQLHYATKANSNNGAQILLQDAMQIQENPFFQRHSFDKITALEMAEHVGIRRYQSFLSNVMSLLKEDGVFYLQVAGLRRAWQYEDLAWGLFMGEHIFPGADASCPLGWVSSQVERAGFEIQQVHNLGTHYSRTLVGWLRNWRANQETIVRKYGSVSYRRWEIFLAWSVRIARRGSSTVFMITLTKAGHEPSRIAAQERIAPLT